MDFKCVFVFLSLWSSSSDTPAIQTAESLRFMTSFNHSLTFDLFFHLHLHVCVWFVPYMRRITSVQEEEDKTLLTREVAAEVHIVHTKSHLYRETPGGCEDSGLSHKPQTVPGSCPALHQPITNQKKSINYTQSNEIKYKFIFIVVIKVIKSLKS